MKKAIKRDRTEVTGQMTKFGSKRNPRGIEVFTVQISNIHRTDKNKFITENMWFKKGKTWLNVRIGDKVTFDTEIQYSKGKMTLYRPTKLKINDMEQ